MVHAYEDEVGRIDLDQLLSLPRAHMAIYTCGPEPMLAAIEDYCMGWPSGALHLERFTSAGTDGGAGAEPFLVELRRSGKTVEIPTDKTVLDCVETAGVRVLSSCRVGVCGTCETRVISGDVEHRDALLGEDDKLAGDSLMLCVSRAAAGCSTLVLDL